MTVTLEDAAALIRMKLGSRASGKLISADSRIEDLGLSSLEMTEVFFEMEDVVGYELDPAQAADVQTLADLVTVVNGMAVDGDRPD